jgi:hypothetical protein
LKKKIKPKEDEEEVVKKMEANRNVKNQEVNTQIGFNHIYGHP